MHDVAPQAVQACGLSLQNVVSFGAVCRDNNLYRIGKAIKLPRKKCDKLRAFTALRVELELACILLVFMRQEASELRNNEKVW